MYKRQALAGMVSGLASAFILFGLVAAVCCKVDIPPHLLLPLSTVAVSFAMLPAGLVFAALHGAKGMLYGLLPMKIQTMVDGQFHYRKVHMIIVISLQKVLKMMLYHH